MTLEDPERRRCGRCLSRLKATNYKGPLVVAQTLKPWRSPAVNVGAEAPTHKPNDLVVGAPLVRRSGNHMKLSKFFVAVGVLFVVALIVYVTTTPHGSDILLTGIVTGNDVIVSPQVAGRMIRLSVEGFRSSQR